ncbi:DNA-directed DNA polymerase gamma [Martiniozyma asiatica (nom. inval.)]|nr:DNA-directed DNA polymerase gamma [Martiniozyma asiatica]
MTPRINPNNIQLLSKELHEQLFPKLNKLKNATKLVDLSRRHLEHNGLADKSTSINEPIHFKLPPLHGKSIAQHFKFIGEWSERPYLELVNHLRHLGFVALKMPDEWQFKSGWIKYEQGKNPISVPYPDDDAVVFDTEVLYKLSPYPVMATALGLNAWYAWVSPYLTGESKNNNHLIPMGIIENPDKEKLIIGHNISYDRARILDEYTLKNNKAFYLDTMSLHVSVSGMCSRQRGAWMKYQKHLKDKPESTQAEKKSIDDYRRMVSSPGLLDLLQNDILDQEQQLNTVDGQSDIVNDALNEDPWLKYSSLSSLAHVAEHHCGIQLEKTTRDWFASLDPNDIKQNFQLLMNYCAKDTLATYHVFHKIWPEFRSVVPHPVSFSALRHITKSFLPTTSDWNDYITRCEKIYQDSKIQIESKLHEICNNIVDLRKEENSSPTPWENDAWLSQLDWTITPPKYTKSGKLYKRQKLPGYPNWFKNIANSDAQINLTTKTRISAFLLGLRWEGNPVFWTDTYGWCFIVSNEKFVEYEKKGYSHIELESLIPPPDLDEDGVALELSKKPLKSKKSTKTEKSKKKINGKSKKKSIVYESDPIVISSAKLLLNEGKTIFKIPHENGPNARVTSLMTKPFQRHFESGTLSSLHPVAREALQLSVQNSYWVSSRERISGQFVVYKENNELSLPSFNSKEAQSCPVRPPEKDQIGMIIPQIVPMGTITRRSVEKTWLTASNAKASRLGSELKSLVRAPPGYCFVGADVDSEELWIASLMGDAVFGLHGGSALGWMTLEGTKNDGTDLHSKTAEILGISRGEAKVFNYGRIYGAGKKFATLLLRKFNPSVSEEEANKTADRLYSATKGESGRLKKVRMWYGGSESVVFNRLEQIAEQDYPRTPVLGAGITQALQKGNLNTNSFLPSRINWAIQSSGVDYLHLLLASMEYLCKYYSIDARLAITVHDEVRYLSKWEDRYKCAMALQIANLWTRSMFCHQVGIEDVPQSCAFFSAVDIDWILRKEVDFECVTPSSPEKLPSGESLDIGQLLNVPEVKSMLDGHMNNFLSAALDEANENTRQSNDANVKLHKQLVKDGLSNPLQQLKPLNREVKNLLKPIQDLDKDLDSATNKLWLELQICQTAEEFTKLKRKFYQEVEFGERKRFSRKIKVENLKEDVASGFEMRRNDINNNDANDIVQSSGVSIENNSMEKAIDIFMNKDQNLSKRKNIKNKQRLEDIESLDIQEMAFQAKMGGVSYKISDTPPKPTIKKKNLHTSDELKLNMNQLQSKEVFNYDSSTMEEIKNAAAIFNLEVDPCIPSTKEILPYGLTQNDIKEIAEM